MAADAGAVMSDAWWLVQVAGVPLVAGWIAERLLDPGLQVRGLALFSGVAGAYFGSWLWTVSGWERGPTLGGHALVPVLVGALAVTALFKMIRLGAAGPRW